MRAAEVRTSPWHFSRGWDADPFAPDCGCGVAPCGHVVETQVADDCPQHTIAAAKTLRSVHREVFCPAEPEVTPDA